MAATLEGGLDAALQRWTGRALTLEARGSEPMRLMAPAALKQRLAFNVDAVLRIVEA